MTFERIREALFFWRNHFTAIALIMVPLALLDSGGQLLVEQLSPAAETSAETPAPFPLLALLWALFVRVLAEATLIPQLAAIEAGRPRRLGECLLLGAASLGVMIPIALVTLGAAAIGALFLILPGLWIQVRLALAPYIAILESRSPREALKLSFIRTDAVQWPMLGAWLLTVLGVLSVANLAGALLIGLLGDHGGSRLLLGVLVALGAAVVQVLMFRFYGLTRPPAASTSGNNLH